MCVCVCDVSVCLFVCLFVCQYVISLYVSVFVHYLSFVQLSVSYTNTFFQPEILLSIPHKLIYLSIYKPQPDSTLDCRIRYVECTRTYMHIYIHTTLWTTRTSECLSKTLKTDEIVSPIAGERTGTYDTPAAL